MKKLLIIFMSILIFSNAYASGEDECMYLAVNEAKFENDYVDNILVPFYIGYICIDNEKKYIELFIKNDAKNRLNNAIGNRIDSINNLQMIGRLHVGAYKEKYEGREEVRPFNYAYATAPKNSVHFPEYVADSLFSDRIYPFRKVLRKNLDPDWVPKFTVQNKVEKGTTKRTADFSYTN